MYKRIIILLSLIIGIVLFSEKRTLDDLATFGVQRTKINANFTELYPSNGDSVLVIDGTGADSLRIYDDGTNAQIVSDNPIIFSNELTMKTLTLTDTGKAQIVFRNPVTSLNHGSMFSAHAISGYNGIEISNNYYNGANWYNDYKSRPLCFFINKTDSCFDFWTADYGIGAVTNWDRFLKFDIDGTINMINNATFTNPDSLVLAEATGIKLANDTRIAGDLSYELRHAYTGFVDSSVTIDLTQDVFSQVSNPTGDLFGDIECKYITCAGDSLTLLTAGSYWWNGFVNPTLLTNNSVYEFQAYVNGVATGLHIDVKAESNSTYIPIPISFYFDGLSVGDDIKLMVTNRTGNGDIVFKGAKLLLIKLY